MTQNQTIIFVCEHGAAKSIIAAAYFNKMASEAGLDQRALARGTHPQTELSQSAVTGLIQDGLTPTETIPQELSGNEINAAHRVISFCELPAAYQDKRDIEYWDEVPPVSENYARARDMILVKLKVLMK